MSATWEETPVIPSDGGWQPFDAPCFAPWLNRWVVVGNDGAGQASVLVSDDDGETWTRYDVTAVSAGAAFSSINGICIAEDLEIFVAVTSNSVGGSSTVTVITSTDGINWTAQASPFDGNFGVRIIRHEALGLFVASGANLDYSTLIATSPDGETWTPQNTPWDGPAPPYNAINALAISGDGTIVAGGSNTGGVKTILTSANATLWVERTTPFDGGATSGSVNALAYIPALGKMIAVGASNDFSSSMMASDDNGATWATVPLSLYDGTFGPQAVTAGPGGTVYIGGNSPNVEGGTSSIFFSSNLTSWTAEATAHDAADDPGPYGITFN